jgi:antirestriction protein ArdC
MPKRTTYITDQRAERLNQASQRLTQAVQAIVSDEDWQSYLSFAAKLHTYSARNSMLLMQQASERGWTSLGHVAGFRTWVTLGRHVRKGERGLWVLAPRISKIIDAKTNEESAIVTGFNVATVFAACQTGGDGPVPELPCPELLTGDGPKGAWEALVALVEARGFTVSVGELEPANGRTDLVARSVLVSSRLDVAARVKTLVHELGHVILHDGPRCDYLTNRGRCEVEAESVAFLVCDSLGLVTDQYSFSYVARWAHGDANIVQAAAETSLTASRSILAELHRVIPDLVLAA